MTCGTGDRMPRCMGSAVFGPGGCTCPELHDLTGPETKPIYITFSDDGRHVRKWSFQQFVGATRYIPEKSQ